MVPKEDIDNALNKMILSASGWRGIFAEDGDEESSTEQISPAHHFICAATAFVFAEYLTRRYKDTEGKPVKEKPLILLGTDTRPTGKTIVKAMIPILLIYGCDVRYAGITAAPEIMAWARKINSVFPTGFIYISASHNPIGHNGIKFGLTDGGVLAADESTQLIADFRSFIKSDDCLVKISSLFSSAPQSLRVILDPQHIKSVKTEALKAYYDFCNEVVWSGSSAIAAALKDGFAKYPLGIVCDFNGSARTVSIDKDIFSAFGFRFECINSEPGQIVHRIVPEGESLEPCCALLEEAHKRDASFVLGYVPDCDGDRGNLVIWDNTIGKARTLEAQEVFALAVVAELSHLVWTGELPCKAAVAINDPTSMRIDHITKAFGVSVFRAEVGEANVVSLARKLRKDGYLVRILGEGSAGGNITHPSAVRDPINTVLAIAKMLVVRSATNNKSCIDGKEGLFKIWHRLSGQTKEYRDDFSLADIIASLPPFDTTSAYHKDAILHIDTQDHTALKDRYQQIFLREWEQRKNELKTRFGFDRWEAIAYNGMTETRGLKRFGEAAKGGLKILFMDSGGRECAYIWLRASATEPVFRIMADVCLTAINDKNAERFLLDWQRSMIIEADNMEQRSGIRDQYCCS